MNNNWADINLTQYGGEDYTGLYQISTFGRIKSLNYNHTGKERIRKLKKDKDGYLRIGLWKNGKVKYYGVHRLVGFFFIPNPENKKFINHKKGIKTDNRAAELEWNTQSENEKHAYKMGFKNQKGEKNNNSKLKWEDIIFIRSLVGFISQIEIVKIFNIPQSQASCIMTYKTWNY